MADQKHFSSSQTIHWPTEFAYIVNMLKGLDLNGQPSHDPLYRYNTGPVLLAATIGLAHNRERDVGPSRQEISTDTFESHRLGNTQSSLASLVLLIALIGTQDVELLRPDREAELIRKFERYAAGGFEYLRGALSTSDDVTGQAVIREEIRLALSAQSDQI
ncbi:MAG: hypothetical protein IPG83_17850 [Novosphingobium sp.]|nr:hypothetical protein [Novosphingobium sp.]